MSRFVPRSIKGRVLAAVALIGASAFFTLFLVGSVLAVPYASPCWANSVRHRESPAASGEGALYIGCSPDQRS